MYFVIYYVTLSCAQYKKIKTGKRRFKDMYIVYKGVIYLYIDINIQNTDSSNTFYYCYQYTVI